MVKISPVEELFTFINETALIIQEEISCTYLEALAETGENLFQGTILQENMSEINKKRLEKLYSQVHLTKYQKEEIRKAYQLVILKGMKDSVQANHQMTPDAIGMLMGYLVSKFVTNKALTLLDPAVGTGNLLATVINQLQGKEIDATGIEVDELLIRLAFVNANLQQHSIEFYNQDSIAPLYVDPVDVVICDLPVGYYPIDERAAEFAVKADQGHTYAHHLLIEQSVQHTKDGGYLFFIIPNGLFESEQAAKLHQLLKENTNIQGILQLPLSIFKSKQAAKSILILQKKAEGVLAPKQALLVNMPSLSNMQAVESIFAQIDLWLKENK
ncbi:class I SAM-dependent methyltransferase [Bacillus marasmi]|uniref:class I SAM-dependent methyltransferase n=1 Tax=Bacillus marasmi TaxID=1926279 RepID=UPI0011CA7F09|nr:class I SAM-dependent methyltransferase [Bacillus marasmi]